MSARPHSDLNLPKGIHRIRPLPEAALGALWDSIILDESIKSQLLSQAMLNFTLRGKVDRSVLPLHGVILLVGPPGTGKTSLARGLAHRTAESFKGGKFRLLEVDPHTLTSAAMGKTQRAVSELFSQSIAEAATGGPVIVLLDEVETLAADRLKMSMEANPIDVHRATDAVLVQLDLLPAGSSAGLSIPETAVDVQIESVRYAACRPLTSATIKQDCNPRIRVGQNAGTAYCPYVQSVTKKVDRSERKVARAL